MKGEAKHIFNHRSFARGAPRGALEGRSCQRPRQPLSKMGDQGNGDGEMGWGGETGGGLDGGGGGKGGGRERYIATSERSLTGAKRSSNRVQK